MQTLRTKWISYYYNETEGVWKVKVAIEREFRQISLTVSHFSIMAYLQKAETEATIPPEEDDDYTANN